MSINTSELLGLDKKNDKMYALTRLVVNTIDVVLLNVTFLYVCQYRNKNQRLIHIYMHVRYI